MTEFRRFAARAALAAAVLTAAAPAVRAQDMVFNQASLVRGLLPTVVNITAHIAVNTPPHNAQTAGLTKPVGSFQVKTSAGSGFIVDPDGVVVTNWHVVDGAYEIFVTFSDGQRVKADLQNAARIVDIALLKVEAGHKLAAVTWGDSAKVQIGDPVLAVGNPLGVGQSVTGGIVSALNRNIMDTPYDDFIQTDAPINHGNSGGPLFDLKGQVIGINTALISNTSSSSGLGFAIPANDAHMIIDRLTHFGWVRPSYIGMKVQQLTPEMATALGMTDTKASIVALVTENGPAAKAGLRTGDVVVSFAGHEPGDERELLRSIATSPAGQPVTLGIVRAGKPMDLHPTLMEWPKMLWEQRDAPIKVAEPHWNVPHDLGLKVKPLTDALRTQNDIPAGTQGLLIASLSAEAEAARQNVEAGDALLQIGDTPVATAADMQREIDKIRAEGKPFGMFLFLQKASRDPGSKSPGPKWLALRVTG